MAAEKQYKDASYYEKKLKTIMEKLNITEYNWDYNRQGSWIEFRYKGSLYRFDHSIDKAKQKGIKLSYGSDAFAQIVLALEDLARMVERGIYDLQTWVTGMRYLPPVVEIPTFFKQLGFDRIPETEEDVKIRFRALAKQLHPDTGGNADDFMAIQKASEEAIKYLKTVNG